MPWLPPTPQTGTAHVFIRKCKTLVYVTTTGNVMLIRTTSAVCHLLSARGWKSNEMLQPTQREGIDASTSRCFIYLSRPLGQLEHQSASCWLMNIDIPQGGQWVIPRACRWDGDQYMLLNNCPSFQPLALMTIWSTQWTLHSLFPLYRQIWWDFLKWFLCVFASRPSAKGRITAQI